MPKISADEVKAQAGAFGKARATAKMVHVARTDEAGKSLCNKPLTVEVPLDEVTGSNLCVACWTVVDHAQGVELTEVDASGIVSNLMDALTGADNKGEESAMAAKNEAKAEGTNYAEIIEQIAANTERAASLAEAENVDGLKELEKENETLISSLPTRGRTPEGVDGLPANVTWAKYKQDARAAWREAATAQPKQQQTAEVVPLVTDEDWRKVEGMEALVNEGAGIIAEGVQLHLKASQTAYNLGRSLLKTRLAARYKGAADLKARSQAVRDASSATKAFAVKQMLESGMDELDAQEAADKLWKSMNNQMGDVLADFAKELGSTDEGKALWESDAFALVREAHKELSAPEAVAAYFNIDLVGPREKARLKAQQKRELAAKAEAALKAGKTDEAEELEAKVAELEGKKELTPAEKAEAQVKKVKSGTNGLSVEEIKELDDDAKKKLRKELEAQLDKLKDLIAATL